MFELGLAYTRFGDFSIGGGGLEDVDDVDAEGVNVVVGVERNSIPEKLSPRLVDA